MIFDLVVIGLAISLEPVPLTSFILVLTSKGGVRKGAGFIFGWLLSLAVVISLAVLATGNKPPKPNTAPSLGNLAVKILLGVVLVIIAVRQWRRMGKPKKSKKSPKWQTHIENMSPWFAMGLGILVQPWPLVATGAAVIIEAKLSSWQSYIALFLFAVISTLTYLVMEIYVGFRPEKAQAVITRIRSWIDTHSDQVIIVLSLVVGFWLISKSIFTVVT